MAALLVTAVVAALLASGCGASDPQFKPQRTASPPARASVSHIAVIVMENAEYSDVLNSGSAPYISSLAKQYALASESFGITHPSLPNYLALTGGSTAGITSDCTDCSVAGAGLAGQLASAGVSWKAYMESLPSPCFKGAGAGEYAKKHDPFIYYRAIAANPAQCSRIVPLTNLAGDERAGLPRFLWISPNLCHDMHDCSVATGDRFLNSLVPPLLQALGPRGLLILTFDEGLSNAGCCARASGGHIVTVLAGGAARPHGVLKTPVDHYSTLQLIEDLLRLRRLGGAACACTPTLAPLLR